MVRLWVRWLAALAFVVGLGLIVAANRREIPAAGRALRGANAGWLALGALALLAWWLARIAIHAGCRSAFGLPGYRELVDLLPVTLAAVAVNSAVKSAGLAGLTIFASDGRRRSLATGPVAGAYLVAVAVGEIGVVTVLTVALCVVWLDGRLAGAEIVAAAVFLGFFGLRVTVLVSAARSRSALRRVWSLPRSIIDRLLRRAAQPATTAADELYDAVQLVRSHPVAVLPASLAAIGVDLLGATMLWVSIAAVGGGSRPVAALVAYAISVLFSIVSLFPGGVGVAEVGAAAVLASFHLPLAIAGAAVVVYRLYAFWLPLAAGAIAARWLRTRAAPRLAR